METIHPDTWDFRKLSPNEMKAVIITLADKRFELSQPEQVAYAKKMHPKDRKAYNEMYANISSALRKLERFAGFKAGEITEATDEEIERGMRGELI